MKHNPAARIGNNSRNRIRIVATEKNWWSWPTMLHCRQQLDIELQYRNKQPKLDQGVTKDKKAVCIHRLGQAKFDC